MASKSPTSKAAASLSPSSKPEATASNATMPAASTRKQSGKFQIPAHWKDVTLERSGTQFAIIGNVFPKPKR